MNPLAAGIHVSDSLGVRRAFEAYIACADSGGCQNRDGPGRLRYLGSDRKYSWERRTYRRVHHQLQAQLGGSIGCFCGWMRMATWWRRWDASDPVGGRCLRIETRRFENGGLTSETILTIDGLDAGSITVSAVTAISEAIRKHRGGRDHEGEGHGSPN